MQNDRMPEGYRLVEGSCKSNGWHIQLQKGSSWPFLRGGKRGNPKLFRSQEKAAQYAREHARLALEYREEVPDKK